MVLEGVDSILSSKRRLSKSADSKRFQSNIRLFVSL